MAAGEACDGARRRWKAVARLDAEVRRSKGDSGSAEPSQEEKKGAQPKRREAEVKEALPPFAHHVAHGQFDKASRFLVRRGGGRRWQRHFKKTIAL
jgi:hypothetical protein